MSTEEIQTLLQQFQPYLEITNWLKDVLRTALWWILTALIWLADNVSGIFTEMFKVFDIIKNPEISTFIKDIAPITWSLAAISIAYFGIRLIIFNETKIAKGFQNIFLGMIVVAISTTVITFLTDSAVSISSTINGKEQSTIVYSMVSKNMSDFYALDEAGTGEKDTSYATITKENIAYIEITESVDRNKLKKYKDVLSKKIKVATDGTVTVVDLSKALWIKEIEGYYRYQFDFLSIAISLIVLIFVYVMSSLKITKLLFEMIYSYTFLNIFALSDIENGERLKKILKNISNVLLTVILSSYMIYLFGMVYPMVTEIDINPLAKLVAQIGIALAVIDGPVIIQELTGYDAGLKSTTLGAFGIFQAGVMVGKPIAKGVSKGMTLAGKGAKTAKDKFGEMFSNRSGKNNQELENAVQDKVADKNESKNKDAAANKPTPQQTNSQANKNKGEEFAEQAKKNQGKYGVSEPIINVGKPSDEARKNVENLRKAEKNVSVSPGQSHQAIIANGASKSTTSKPKISEVNLPHNIRNDRGNQAFQKNIKGKK